MRILCIIICWPRDAWAIFTGAPLALNGGIVSSTLFTLIVLPGIGVPQRAFRHLANWLATRGARCLTVDYRGMGASANSRGIASATLSAWAREDAAVSTFLDRFFAVDPERRQLAPRQFGAKTIGHVGLLWPAVGTAGVWQEILEFLNDNVGAEPIR